MSHDDDYLPMAGDIDDLYPLSEAEAPEIQELLDQGYTQLDGFVSWLEERLDLDTRTAQQDCFNAESLIDYLANHHHKSAFDTNEFALRWFVFSHYIRKSIADRETEERLPDSLMRFFIFLQARHGMDLPDWIYATLEDQAFYLGRLRAFAELDQEDEAQWKEGFRAWCEELEQDLDTRCLWLPNDMGEGMEWQERMGWREATLREEANDLWQREREELIRDGLHFEAIRDRLTSSYLIWLDTPQARLEGKTARETVQTERAEQAMTAEAEEDSSDDRQDS